MNISKIENDLFRIFPNPSTGTFNIVGLQNIKQLNVFNSLGQQVEKLDVSNQNVVTLQLKQRGVYLVKITDKSGDQRIEKVIVR